MQSPTGDHAGDHHLSPSFTHTHTIMVSNHTHLACSRPRRSWCRGLGRRATWSHTLLARKKQDMSKTFREDHGAWRPRQCPRITPRIITYTNLDRDARIIRVYIQTPTATYCIAHLGLWPLFFQIAILTCVLHLCAAASAHRAHAREGRPRLWSEPMGPCGPSRGALAAACG